MCIRYEVNAIKYNIACKEQQLYVGIVSPKFIAAIVLYYST